VIDRDQPLTYEWLRSNGWRLLARQERQPTDHVRRDVACEVAGGRQPFVASDDLGIELAAGGMEGWFCWITRQEPRQSIHVRPVSTVGDVMRLWEGLTGRDWPRTGEVPHV
jgi:hypothetical protein